MVPAIRHARIQKDQRPGARKAARGITGLRTIPLPLATVARHETAMNPASIVAPPLNPPVRILMGPGPSDIHPRVLQALSKSTVGHLDPYFLQVMDELQSMLRQVFRTENKLTLAVISAISTSHAMPAMRSIFSFDW